MTTIVALPTDKGTWIGSDSQAINNDTKVYRSKKWHNKGEWWVGVAGDARTKAVIEYMAAKPSSDPVVFCGQIRDALIEDGYKPEEQSPGCQGFGQQIIIARTGGAHIICPGFSCQEIHRGDLWADGSGRPYALGAGLQPGPPRTRVKRALEAALHFDPYSGGDIFIRRI